jgi:acetyl esterase
MLFAATTESADRRYQSSIYNCSINRLSQPRAQPHLCYSQNNLTVREVLMIRSCRSAIRSFFAVVRCGVLVSLTVLAGFSAASSAQANIQRNADHKRGPVGKPYVYKTVDGYQLHLYVLEPAGTAVQPRPTIIFFHGGGWYALSAGQFNRQAKYLVARGMTAIEVEYRLIPEAGDTPPKICAEDAKSAVRWVREHHSELGVDPNMIVESGGSAGGYLAAFASMVPRWNDPHDDLNVSAKADLLALYNPVIDNSPTGYGNRRFGKDYKQWSPLFYVTPDTPPTLIQSGWEDKYIHAPVLEQLKKRYEEVGVPIQLILYKGVGHGFFNHEPYLTQTTEALANFLRENGYLK